MSSARAIDFWPEQGLLVFLISFDGEGLHARSFRVDKRHVQGR